MSELVADIFDDRDKGALKIKWFRGAHSQRPYRIRREAMTQAAERVRAVLQGLVEAAHHGRHAEFPELVRKLAKEGHELYKILFSGIDSIDRINAGRAQEWVGQRSRQDTITFTVPSRVHLPWGLIYDEPVSDNPVDIEHFWCLKHSAAAHYFDCPPEWVDQPWPAKDFGILFGAHDELWKTAQLGLDAPEQKRLLGLLLHPEQPKFRLEDMYAAWDTKKADLPPGLLSFFCHASGTDLLIGAETLSATDFERKFARNEIKTCPPTLVFLAGCRTAIGSLAAGFLEATSGPGFCGFIGTEVLVPDIFTLRFLAQFLDRLFASGRSVSEVMQDLRREHWPLSLVFSICCTGELRLTPAQPVPPFAGKIKNLSYQPVSSE